MNRSLTFGVILTGVAIAVVAGVIVDWLAAKMSIASAQPGQRSWALTLTECSKPNLNTTPQSPAMAYPAGAPTDISRSMQRIGKIFVPGCQPV